MSDIWQDVEVKYALKEGRSANDIMVLSCPKCGKWSYWNEGCSFYCKHCQKSFYCCSENEKPPEGVRHLYIDDCDPTQLADTVTDCTDGYDNETRNAQ